MGLTFLGLRSFVAKAAWWISITKLLLISNPLIVAMNRIPETKRSKSQRYRRKIRGLKWFVKSVERRVDSIHSAMNISECGTRDLWLNAKLARNGISKVKDARGVNPVAFNQHKSRKDL
jgi:hypothetical protein